MVDVVFGAVLLAGGKGTRMGSAQPKQYMDVDGKPLLYYSLKAIEQSTVSQIVIVVAEGDKEYVDKNIVQKYHFQKVLAIVTGGSERYLSVYEGLKAFSHVDYVMIHDGARPCITKEILERATEGVMINGACVAAVKVKDTIKIANEKNQVESTPPRNQVWMVQTPQTFAYELIRDAYERCIAVNGTENKMGITDDAMVLEQMTNHPVTLIEGSYDNIKVTTLEDLYMIEKFIKMHTSDWRLK